MEGRTLADENVKDAEESPMPSDCSSRALRDRVKSLECASTRVLGQGDTVTNLMARYIRRNGRAKLTGRPSGAVMIVSVSVPIRSIRSNGNVCKPRCNAFYTSVYASREIRDIWIDFNARIKTEAWLDNLAEKNLGPVG